jgi:hypothetical protein
MHSVNEMSPSLSSKVGSAYDEYVVLAYIVRVARLQDNETP